MTLQHAIEQRQYHLNRFMKAQEQVDELAKEAAELAEMERMNRELTGGEVYQYCDVTDRTVYGWPTEAITYIEWSRFLKGYKHGKYYKQFMNNFKKENG